MTYMGKAPLFLAKGNPEINLPINTGFNICLVYPSQDLLLKLCQEVLYHQKKLKFSYAVVLVLVLTYHSLTGVTPDAKKLCSASSWVEVDIQSTLKSWSKQWVCTFSAVWFDFWGSSCATCLQTKEAACVSVLNCTDCASRSHSALSKEWLESGTGYSVLIPTCDMVPSF